MLISAQEISLRFNDQVILDRATLAISEGDHLGLVGRNGAGKSTFLRLLAGELQPDSGVITRKRELVVGYLPQTFELNENLTVYEAARAGAGPALRLIEEFESLPGHSARHEELEERIQQLDGWNVDARVRSTLNQLGCPPDDRRVGNLSGGERRRVALAQALICQPDLLILDEPTNHLDSHSVSWITEFLGDYSGGLLVVTHDRHFLDSAVNGMVELRNGVFERYDGAYTDYLERRSEKIASEELNEHKRQMFLRREIEWVRRRPKAQTSKSRARLDRFQAATEAAPPPPEFDMELVIPPPPPLGNRVVELEGVGMIVGGKRLFSGLSLQFANRTRIGVTGRNGVGKTTLLRVILGQLPPTEGAVRTGQLTRFNYVDQSRLQLNDERTVLDEISDGPEWVQWGDQKLSIRAYLRRFLFADDRMLTRVKHLSGGERSRLLLARILKRGGNFIVLDEPTNDLDLQTLRVLEEALAGFPGCVLVVSHDRYFLNRVCTGILAFEDGGRLVHSEGNYDYYLEKKSRAALPAPKLEPNPFTKPPPPIPAPVKPRPLGFKEQRELEGMDAAILTCEADIAEREALFARPDFHQTHGPKTDELVAQLAAARDKLAALYSRWEQLEARRAASPPG